MVPILYFLILSSHNRIHDFGEKLYKAGARIFVPQSDHGYYRWTPAAPSLGLEEIRADEDFGSQLDLEGTPQDIIDPNTFSLPISFRTNKKQIWKCCYPHGQLDMPGLYVATNHRGVDLEDIDFVFGGSALNIFATQETNNNYHLKDENKSYYYTVRIPGSSKTILVSKRKMYNQNYQSAAFQFERLMTGGSIHDKHYVDFCHHLQTMSIGGRYNVLFNAEIDAAYRDNPIEIKTSQRKYWESKVFFQMVSNGSTTLCHGIRRHRKLRHIKLLNLHKVATLVERNFKPMKELEQNILKNMDALQSKMKDAKVGQVFNIYFRNGELVLEPFDNKESGLLMLPPNEVVASLLSKGKRRRKN